MIPRPAAYPFRLMTKSKAIGTNKKASSQTRFGPSRAKGRTVTRRGIRRAVIGPPRPICAEGCPWKSVTIGSLTGLLSSDRTPAGPAVVPGLLRLGACNRTVQLRKRFHRLGRHDLAVKAIG